MIELSTAGKLALFVAIPTTIALLYCLLKRSDEEEEEQPKVKKSRQTVIEVTIPQKAVGAVIGRQGSYIKQIQETTGAKVHFKDDSKSNKDSDRVLEIRGTSESAGKAELLIRKVIADMPVIIVEELYVPTNSVGRIIGSGGENIRSIQSASNCKTYVERKAERKAQSSSTLIRLTGSRQQIDLAKSMIEEKVQEEEVFRAKAAVNASNREQRIRQRKDAQITCEKAEVVYSSTAAASTDNWDTGQVCEWPEQKEYLEVYISAMENPGHFWVQLLSSNALQLDSLAEKMTLYYNQEHTKQTHSIDSISVGDIVAAPFTEDDTFYRARVIGFDEDKIDLYFVDYGDNALVSRDQIRQLRVDFLSLPFQAIECFMANVKPKDGEWTEESSDAFEQLAYCAKWKVIMAKTVSYKRIPSGPAPCLQLIDTNGKLDINLNEEMVKRGHAVWDEETIRPDTATPVEAETRQVVNSKFTTDSASLSTDATSHIKNNTKKVSSAEAPVFNCVDYIQFYDCRWIGIHAWAFCPRLQFRDHPLCHLARLPLMKHWVGPGASVMENLLCDIIQLVTVVEMVINTLEGEMEKFWKHIADDNDEDKQPAMPLDNTDWASDYPWAWAYNEDDYANYILKKSSTTSRRIVSSVDKTQDISTSAEPDGSASDVADNKTLLLTDDGSPTVDYARSDTTAALSRVNVRRKDEVSDVNEKPGQSDLNIDVKEDLNSSKVVSDQTLTIDSNLSNIDRITRTMKPTDVHEQVPPTGQSDLHTAELDQKTKTVTVNNSVQEYSETNTEVQIKQPDIDTSEAEITTVLDDNVRQTEEFKQVSDEPQTLPTDTFVGESEMNLKTTVDSHFSQNVLEFKDSATVSSAEKMLKTNNDMSDNVDRIVSDGVQIISEKETGISNTDIGNIQNNDMVDIPSSEKVARVCEEEEKTLELASHSGIGLNLNSKIQEFNICEIKESDLQLDERLGSHVMTPATDVQTTEKPDSKGKTQRAVVEDYSTELLNEIWNNVTSHQESEEEPETDPYNLRDSGISSPEYLEKTGQMTFDSVETRKEDFDSENIGLNLSDLVNNYNISPYPTISHSEFGERQKSEASVTVNQDLKHTSHPGETLSSSFLEYRLEKTTPDSDDHSPERVPDSLENTGLTKNSEEKKNETVDNSVCNITEMLDKMCLSEPAAQGFHAQQNESADAKDITMKQQPTASLEDAQSIDHTESTLPVTQRHIVQKRKSQQFEPFPSVETSEQFPRRDRQEIEDVDVTDSDYKIKQLDKSYSTTCIDSDLQSVLSEASVDSLAVNFDTRSVQSVESEGFDFQDNDEDVNRRSSRDDMLDDFSDEVLKRKNTIIENVSGDNGEMGALREVDNETQQTSDLIKAVQNMLGSSNDKNNTDQSRNILQVTSTELELGTKDIGDNTVSINVFESGTSLPEEKLMKSPQEKMLKLEIKAVSKPDSTGEKDVDASDNDSDADTNLLHVPDSYPVEDTSDSEQVIRHISVPMITFSKEDKVLLTPESDAAAVYFGEDSDLYKKYYSKFRTEMAQSYYSKDSARVCIDSNLLSSEQSRSVEASPVVSRENSPVGSPRSTKKIFKFPDGDGEYDSDDGATKDHTKELLDQIVRRMSGVEESRIDRSAINEMAVTSRDIGTGILKNDNIDKELNFASTSPSLNVVETNQNQAVQIESMSFKANLEDDTLDAIRSAKAAEKGYDGDESSYDEDDFCEVDDKQMFVDERVEDKPNDMSAVDPLEKTIADKPLETIQTNNSVSSTEIHSLVVTHDSSFGKEKLTTEMTLVDNHQNYDLQNEIVPEDTSDLNVVKIDDGDEQINAVDSRDATDREKLDGVQERIKSGNLAESDNVITRAIDHVEQTLDIVPAESLVKSGTFSETEISQVPETQDIMPDSSSVTENKEINMLQNNVSTIHIQTDQQIVTSSEVVVNVPKTETSVLQETNFEQMSIDHTERTALDKSPETVQNDNMVLTAEIGSLYAIHDSSTDKDSLITEISAVDNLQKDEISETRVTEVTTRVDVSEIGGDEQVNAVDGSVTVEEEKLNTMQENLQADEFPAPDLVSARAIDHIEQNLATVPPESFEKSATISETVLSLAQETRDIMPESSSVTENREINTQQNDDTSFGKPLQAKVKTQTLHTPETVVSDTTYNENVIIDSTTDGGDTSDLINIATITHNIAQAEKENATWSGKSLKYLDDETIYIKQEEMLQHMMPSTNETEKDCQEAPITDKHLPDDELFVSDCRDAKAVEYGITAVTRMDATMTESPPETTTLKHDIKEIKTMSDQMPSSVLSAESDWHFYAIKPLRYSVDEMLFQIQNEKTNIESELLDGQINSETESCQAFLHDHPESIVTVCVGQTSLESHELHHHNLPKTTDDVNIVQDLNDNTYLKCISQAELESSLWTCKCLKLAEAESTYRTHQCVRLEVPLTEKIPTDVKKTEELVDSQTVLAETFVSELEFIPSPISQKFVGIDTLHENVRHIEFAEIPCRGRSDIYRENWNIVAEERELEPKAFSDAQDVALSDSSYDTMNTYAYYRSEWEPTSAAVSSELPDPGPMMKEMAEKSIQQFFEDPTSDNVRSPFSDNKDDNDEITGEKDESPTAEDYIQELHMETDDVDITDQEKSIGLQEAPKELHERPKELQTEPEELQTEPKELETEPTELQTEPKELQTEPKELKIEPEELKIEPEELQTEPEELQTKSEELQTEPEELQTEPKELQTEPEELQTEPEELQTEPEELQTEPEELKTVIVDTYQTSVTEQEVRTLSGEGNGLITKQMLNTDQFYDNKDEGPSVNKVFMSDLSGSNQEINEQSIDHSELHVQFTEPDVLEHRKTEHLAELLINDISDHETEDQLEQENKTIEHFTILNTDNNVLLAEMDSCKWGSNNWKLCHDETVYQEYNEKHKSNTVLLNQTMLGTEETVIVESSTVMSENTTLIHKEISITESIDGNRSGQDETVASETCLQVSSEKIRKTDEIEQETSNNDVKTNQSDDKVLNLILATEPPTVQAENSTWEIKKLKLNDEEAIFREKIQDNIDDGCNIIEKNSELAIDHIEQMQEASKRDTLTYTQHCSTGNMVENVLLETTKERLIEQPELTQYTTSTLHSERIVDCEDIVDEATEIIVDEPDLLEETEELDTSHFLQKKESEDIIDETEQKVCEEQLLLQTNQLDSGSFLNEPLQETEDIMDQNKVVIPCEVVSNSIGSEIQEVVGKEPLQFQTDEITTETIVNRPIEEYKDIDKTDIVDKLGEESEVTAKETHEVVSKETLQFHTDEIDTEAIVNRPIEEYKDIDKKDIVDKLGEESEVTATETHEVVSKEALQFHTDEIDTETFVIKPIDVYEDIDKTDDLVDRLHGEGEVRKAAEEIVSMEQLQFNTDELEAETFLNRPTEKCEDIDRTDDLINKLGEESLDIVKKTEEIGSKEQLQFQTDELENDTLLSSPTEELKLLDKTDDLVDRLGEENVDIVKETDQVGFEDQIEFNTDQRPVEENENTVEKINDILVNEQATLQIDEIENVMYVQKTAESSECMVDKTERSVCEETLTFQTNQLEIDSSQMPSLELGNMSVEREETVRIQEIDHTECFEKALTKDVLTVKESREPIYFEVDQNTQEAPVSDTVLTVSSDTGGEKLGEQLTLETVVHARSPSKEMTNSDQESERNILKEVCMLEQENVKWKTKYLKLLEDEALYREKCVADENLNICEIPETVFVCTEESGHTQTEEHHISVTTNSSEDNMSYKVDVYDVPVSMDQPIIENTTIQDHGMSMMQTIAGTESAIDHKEYIDECASRDTVIVEHSKILLPQTCHSDETVEVNTVCDDNVDASYVVGEETSTSHSEASENTIKATMITVQFDNDNMPSNETSISHSDGIHKIQSVIVASEDIRDEKPREQDTKSLLKITSAESESSYWVKSLQQLCREETQFYEKEASRICLDEVIASEQNIKDTDHLDSVENLATNFSPSSDWHDNTIQDKISNVSELDETTTEQQLELSVKYQHKKPVELEELINEETTETSVMISDHSKETDQIPTDDMESSLSIDHIEVFLPVPETSSLTTKGLSRKVETDLEKLDEELYTESTETTTFSRRTTVTTKIEKTRDNINIEEQLDTEKHKQVSESEDISVSSSWSQVSSENLFDKKLAEILTQVDIDPTQIVTRVSVLDSDFIDEDQVDDDMEQTDSALLNSEIPEQVPLNNTEACSEQDEYMDTYTEITETDISVSQMEKTDHMVEVFASGTDVESTETRSFSKVMTETEHRSDRYVYPTMSPTSKIPVSPSIITPLTLSEATSQLALMRIIQAEKLDTSDKQQSAVENQQSINTTDDETLSLNIQPDEDVDGEQRKKFSPRDLDFQSGSDLDGIMDTEGVEESDELAHRILEDSLEDMLERSTSLPLINILDSEASRVDSSKSMPQLPVDDEDVIDEDKSQSPYDNVLHVQRTIQEESSELDDSFENADLYESSDVVNVSGISAFSEDTECQTFEDTLLTLPDRSYSLPLLNMSKQITDSQVTETVSEPNIQEEFQSTTVTVAKADSYSDMSDGPDILDLYADDEETDDVVGVVGESASNTVSEHVIQDEFQSTTVTVAKADSYSDMSDGPDILDLYADDEETDDVVGVVGESASNTVSEPNTQEEFINTAVIVAKADSYSDMSDGPDILDLYADDEETDDVLGVVGETSSNIVSEPNTQEEFINTAVIVTKTDSYSDMSDGPDILDLYADDEETDDVLDDVEESTSNTSFTSDTSEIKFTSIPDAWKARPVDCTEPREQVVKKHELITSSISIERTEDYGKNEAMYSVLSIIPTENINIQKTYDDQKETHITEVLVMPQAFPIEADMSTTEVQITGTKETSFVHKEMVVDLDQCTKYARQISTASVEIKQPELSDTTVDTKIHEISAPVNTIQSSVVETDFRKVDFDVDMSQTKAEHQQDEVLHEIERTEKCLNLRSREKIEQLESPYVTSDNKVNEITAELTTIQITEEDNQLEKESINRDTSQIRVAYQQEEKLQEIERTEKYLNLRKRQKIKVTKRLQSTAYDRKMEEHTEQFHISESMAAELKSSSSFVYVEDVDIDIGDDSDIDSVEENTSEHNRLETVMAELKTGTTDLFIMESSSGFEHEPSPIKEYWSDDDELEEKLTPQGAVLENVTAELKMETKTTEQSTLYAINEAEETSESRTRYLVSESASAEMRKKKLLNVHDGESGPLIPDAIQKEFEILEAVTEDMRSEYSHLEVEMQSHQSLDVEPPARDAPVQMNLTSEYLSRSKTPSPTGFIEEENEVHLFISENGSPPPQRRRPLYDREVSPQKSVAVTCQGQLKGVDLLKEIDRREMFLIPDAPERYLVGRDRWNTYSITRMDRQIDERLQQTTMETRVLQTTTELESEMSKELEGLNDVSISVISGYGEQSLYDNIEVLREIDRREESIPVDNRDATFNQFVSGMGSNEMYNSETRYSMSRIQVEEQTRRADTSVVYEEIEQFREADDESEHRLDLDDSLVIVETDEEGEIISNDIKTSHTLADDDSNIEFLQRKPNEADLSVNSKLGDISVDDNDAQTTGSKCLERHSLEIVDGREINVTEASEYKIDEDVISELSMNEMNKSKLDVEERKLNVSEHSKNGEHLDHDSLNLEKIEQGKPEYIQQSLKNEKSNDEGWNTPEEFQLDDVDNMMPANEMPKTREEVDMEFDDLQKLNSQDINELQTFMGDLDAVQFRQSSCLESERTRLHALGVLNSENCEHALNSEDTHTAANKCTSESVINTKSETSESHTVTVNNSGTSVVPHGLINKTSGSCDHSTERRDLSMDIDSSKHLPQSSTEMLPSPKEITSVSVEKLRASVENSKNDVEDLKNGLEELEEYVGNLESTMDKFGEGSVPSNRSSLLFDTGSEYSVNFGDSLTSPSIESVGIRSPSVEGRQLVIGENEPNVSLAQKHEGMQGDSNSGRETNFHFTNDGTEAKGLVTDIPGIYDRLTGDESESISSYDIVSLPRQSTESIETRPLVETSSATSARSLDELSVELERKLVSSEPCAVQYAERVTVTDTYSHSELSDAVENTRVIQTPSQLSTMVETATEKKKKKKRKKKNKSVVSVIGAPVEVKPEASCPLPQAIDIDESYDVMSEETERVESTEKVQISRTEINPDFISCDTYMKTCEKPAPQKSLQLSSSGNTSDNQYFDIVSQEIDHAIDSQFTCANFTPDIVDEPENITDNIDIQSDSDSLDLGSAQKDKTSEVCVVGVLCDKENVAVNTELKCREVTTSTSSEVSQSSSDGLELNSFTVMEYGVKQKATTEQRQGRIKQSTTDEISMQDVSYNLQSNCEKVLTKSDPQSLEGNIHSNSTFDEDDVSKKKSRRKKKKEKMQVSQVTQDLTPANSPDVDNKEISHTSTKKHKATDEKRNNTDSTISTESISTTKVVVKTQEIALEAFETHSSVSKKTMTKSSSVSSCDNKDLTTHAQKAVVKSKKKRSKTDSAAECSARAVLPGNSEYEFSDILSESERVLQLRTGFSHMKSEKKRTPSKRSVIPTIEQSLTVDKPHVSGNVHERSLSPAVRGQSGDNKNTPKQGSHQKMSKSRSPSTGSRFPSLTPRRRRRKKNIVVVTIDPNSAK